MAERIRRSIVKTLTWRIEASILTALLIYFFTGDIVFSMGLGLIDFFIKLLFYYLNERMWNKIKWGQRKDS